MAPVMHSQSKIETISCSICRASFAAEVWEIVDLGERPDLASSIGKRRLNVFTCPSGHQVQATEHLLLFKHGRRPPIMFVASGEPLQAHEQEAMERLARRLIETFTVPQTDREPTFVLETQIIPDVFLPLVTADDPDIQLINGPIIGLLKAPTNTKMVDSLARNDETFRAAVFKALDHLEQLPPYGAEADRWKNFIGGLRTRVRAASDELARNRTHISEIRDEVRTKHKATIEQVANMLVEMRRSGKLSKEQADMVSELGRLVERGGSFEDFQAATSRFPEIHAKAMAAVVQQREGSSPALVTLAQEAKAFCQRYDHHGDLSALDESITRYASLTSHPDWLTASKGFRAEEWDEIGRTYAKRYERRGMLSDLDSAVDALHKAVAEAPDDDSDKYAKINELAIRLRDRFNRTNRLDDIDQAIDLSRLVVQLLPPSHREAPIGFNNLGNALRSRFERTGDLKDLEDALCAYKEGGKLATEGHPHRWLNLLNLGVGLFARFKQFGDAADLESSISIWQQAVRLSPPRERHKVYSNLANALDNRFDLVGDDADIDAAGKYAKMAVEGLPDGHPLAASYLFTLGNQLSTRYRKTDDQGDLDGAITSYQQALNLIPADHPHRPGMLNNLAIRLSDRFRRTKHEEDLKAATALKKEALQRTPSNHPLYGILLNNLSTGHLEQFTHGRDPRDLKLAIEFSQQAVELTPADFPSRPEALYNLGSALIAHYEQTKKEEDARAANAVLKDALNALSQRMKPGLETTGLSARISHYARRLAQGLVYLKDFAELVATLEASKAARLRFEIARSSRVPSHLNEQDKEEYRRLVGVAQEQATIIRHFYSRASFGTLGQTQSRDKLAAAMQLHAETLDRLRAFDAGDPDFSLRPLDYASVRALARRYRQAIVYLQPLYQTHSGLIVVIVHPGSPQQGPDPKDVLHVEGPQAAGEVGEVLGQLKEMATGVRLLEEKLSSSEKDMAENNKEAYRPELFEQLVRRKSYAELVDQLLGVLESKEGEREHDDTMRLWITGYWLRKFSAGVLPTSPRMHLFWLDVIDQTHKSLSSQIVIPLARRLKELGADRVSLIAGDGLTLLPIHSAPLEDGLPFCERFHVSYMPSATVLAQCVGRRSVHAAPKPHLVAIADPDGTLAFAQEEVRRIALLFPQTAAVAEGTDARRQWLFESLAIADFVELATHAVFDTRDPGASYFLLAHPHGYTAQHRPADKYPGKRPLTLLQSESEKVIMDDIWSGRMPLKAGAVVSASACETGLIEAEHAPEEFVGFPAAFLSVGATSVIASFWSVDDFSTALLIEQFYKHMVKDKLHSAVALHKAGSWLRQLNKAEVIQRLDDTLAQLKRDRASGLWGDTEDAAYQRLTAHYDKFANERRRLVASASECPFAHPYYWSAFAAYGSTYENHPAQGQVRSSTRSNGNWLGRLFRW
jgi:CHAT domain-containing protein/tetratricopeptide (TPR) repeat protein